MGHPLVVAVERGLDTFRGEGGSGVVHPTRIAPPGGRRHVGGPGPLLLYARGVVRRTLVLASGSAARLRLLRDAGFDPKVEVSGVDEEGVRADDTRALVGELAERKADAVAVRVEDAVVVGCDSLFEFEGRRHGKPATLGEARGWLRAMRGRSGTLFTGHCVIDVRDGTRASGVAATNVRFAAASDEEIEAYLRTGEPMAAAGAFTLDGRSAPFVDGVDGDPSNVVGLSLPLFRVLLGRLGLAVTDLWGEVGP